MVKAISVEGAVEVLGFPARGPIEVKGQVVGKAEGGGAV